MRQQRDFESGSEIGFGARDKEGARLVQRMQTGEVDIPAIHHADRAGFREQHVKRVNIVQLAVRDVNETRDIAAQIEQRMHLHGGLGGPEMRPGEPRQAQVDGRGIQRVDAVS
jgi:hypothetical protein